MKEAGTIETPLIVRLLGLVIGDNRNDGLVFFTYREGAMKEKEELEEQESTYKNIYTRADHPWVEMQQDEQEDSVDETVRYSLDELRVS